MNLNKIQDKIAIVFNNLEHKEDTENADLLVEVLNDIKALSIADVIVPKGTLCDDKTETIIDGCTCETGVCFLKHEH